VDTTWKLSGRTIKGNIPVAITVRNEDVLTFHPAVGVFQPMPSRLLGFAKLNPEEDEYGEHSVISSGRLPDVSYDEATNGGVSVCTGELYPYFYGGGTYELLLAITIDSFEQLPS
jgi:hypothetical protein